MGDEVMIAHIDLATAPLVSSFMDDRQEGCNFASTAHKADAAPSS